MWDLISIVTGSLPEQWEFLKGFVFVAGLYLFMRIVDIPLAIIKASFAGFFRGR